MTIETDGKTRTVRGIVREQVTGSPLPGARVQLVELRRVTYTNRNGRFAFQRVPPRTFTNGIHLKGYSSHHQVLADISDKELAITLEPAAVQEEIVVSASPFVAIDRLDVPQQVDVQTGEEIRRAGTGSVGDALSEIPGVSNIPTGDALGTPVIRGLSENRIRVLNDGVPLNHQQFSWRHSPNIEASLAHAVEVVRGPMSVLYGPDAMGGIVNIIQAPLMVAPEGEVNWRGEIAGGWGTNADQFTGRAQIQGAAGGLGWNLGLVTRDSDSIETPEQSLENTDFEQTNGNFALGYVSEFGTVRVRASHWELDTGFYRPPGFRLGLDDDLVAADLFLPTSHGDFELKMGQQTNIRKAFPAPLQGAPAVDLKQVTQSARAGWHHRSMGPWRGEVAAEFLSVENDARALGKLLPEYDSDAMAVMAFEEGRFVPGRDGLPVFDYRQDDAAIRGVEVSWNTTLAPWCHVGGDYSWIETENKAQDRPLPQEPASRFGLRARFLSPELGRMQSAFAEIRVQHVGSQEVSGPDEPFGVSTESYTPWGLNVGCEWPLQRVLMGVDLTVYNLLDETYTDFLYSYKDVANNTGRDIRLMGRLMF